MFHELQQRHMNQLHLEKEKGDYSFKARRRLLESVGLEQVRAHRLRLLQSEEEAWRLDLARQEQVLPELKPILFVRVL